MGARGGRAHHYHGLWYLGCVFWYLGWCMWYLWGVFGVRDGVFKTNQRWKPGGGEISKNSIHDKEAADKHDCDDLWWLSWSWQCQLKTVSVSPTSCTIFSNQIFAKSDPPSVANVSMWLKKDNCAFRTELCCDVQHLTRTTPSDQNTLVNGGTTGWIPTWILYRILLND